MFYDVRKNNTIYIWNIDEFLENIKNDSIGQDDSSQLMCLIM